MGGMPGMGGMGGMGGMPGMGGDFGDDDDGDDDEDDDDMEGDKPAATTSESKTTDDGHAAQAESATKTGEQEKSA